VTSRLGTGKTIKKFTVAVSKSTKASVHCTIITSSVFQVGFAGLSPSSQHLLLQLEAVYDLLQSLSTSPPSQAIVTQYSEELSGQDMKAAESQDPASVASQDVEDQIEAEDDMPEEEKKEAAELNNEAKSEATAPTTPLPDLITCHQPLVAPVAIASGGISCHASEVNHRRLPDLVLSGLRRPPEERNLSAGRRAVINTVDLSDDASVGNDAAATAANIGELCLRPPVGRLSSHPVLPAAFAAKCRRRSFRIGHPAERHGAVAGGTDVLRAGGHHPLLLRRAVVWRQAGAELANIADSLMAVSGGGRLVVAVANPRQLAAANQRINSEEEEERMEDVMMDSWEGLLLTVMARAVLYACLSRLKRLLF
jgi:hypothetical protein